MTSLPEGYRALVIGASGAIGSAFVSALEADPLCSNVVALHRASFPCIDFDRPQTVQLAADALAAHSPFHLIIHAAGILHTETFQPEKKLSNLNIVQMEQTFRVNTFGPALVMSEFLPLLARSRAIFAVLSAKVGSIGDNRLGGWYSYRSSKAALNMLLKTAAIEVKRSKPEAVLVALHPGTVASKLSRPFRGDDIGRAPVVAAREMLDVLDRLKAPESGKFFSYNGDELPW